MTTTDTIVYFDMDGTIADFDEVALRDIPKSERVLRNNFYVTDDYPDKSESIKAIHNAPGFFETLPLLPGVIETWQLLIAHGYRPRILSAPLRANATSIAGKKAWLQKHFVPVFGAWVVDEAIFDKRKWEYPGLALIDDRPDVLRGQEAVLTAPWEHILFGWSHLDVVPGSIARYRLHDWSEPERLLDLLKQIETKKKLTIR